MASPQEARRGEFGTVLTYQSDRYTATVRTERGRTLTGVPRLRSTPGEIAPLEPGTEVLLNFDYGTPLILGVLAAPVHNAEGGPKFSITDTEGFGGQGLNRTALDIGSEFRNPREPDDVAPGDWVQMSTDGNAIGVLAGGVNVMRSSGLSQVRTHFIDDMVEIISRNYRHVTDMGEFTIKNNEGRITMRFRGGTDPSTETRPEEENWTIKFDLGAEGDLMNLEFTTPQGQTLFRFRVDSDGQCELFGINGVSIHSGAQAGGASTETSTGDKESVLLGNHQTRIEGDRTTEVRGSAATHVLHDKEESAGNDLRSEALRDYGISAGRNLYMSVQGNLTGDAVVFDIESGDWRVDIGSATSPNPQSGHTLRTFGGSINYESLAGGDFNVQTLLGDLHTRTKRAVISTNLLPDSVVLGGESLSSHVVKYEQLEQHLLLLYQLLDQHMHLEPGTSVAAGIFPVTGVSGPPVVPFSAVLNPLVLTMKSITTGVAL